MSGWYRLDRKGFLTREKSLTSNEYLALNSVAFNLKKVASRECLTGTEHARTKSLTGNECLASKECLTGTEHAPPASLCCWR